MIQEQPRAASREEHHIHRDKCGVLSLSTSRPSMPSANATAGPCSAQQFHISGPV